MNINTNNLIKNGAPSDRIDSTWHPIVTSPSVSMYEKVSSQEFQDSLIKMQKEFESIVPKNVDQDGDLYVSLMERTQLIEDCFPYGTFHFVYQFLNVSSDVPVCCGTLHILAGDSYEPWFSRFGMGDPSNIGPDGLFADAETSARRRLMAAIGLGREGDKEIIESEAAILINSLGSFCSESGMAFCDLTSEYMRHHTKYELPALEKRYLVENIKPSEKDGFTMDMVSDADLVKIAKYISMKKG
jgi:hypothetical protein